jgi:hypothetical protein
MGHQVVDRTVLRLLKAKGYSLQAKRKRREGASHPDRDAQFETGAQLAILPSLLPARSGEAVDGVEMPVPPQEGVSSSRHPAD